MSWKRLRRGDIITQIGDVSLDDQHPYMNALFNYPPGQTIPIQINRNGRTLEVKIKLGKAQ